jgi:hypothetical protein
MVFGGGGMKTRVWMLCAIAVLLLCSSCFMPVVLEDRPYDYYADQGYVVYAPVVVDATPIHYTAPLIYHRRYVWYWGGSSYVQYRYYHHPPHRVYLPPRYAKRVYHGPRYYKAPPRRHPPRHVPNRRPIHRRRH